MITSFTFGKWKLQIKSGSYFFCEPKNRVASNIAPILEIVNSVLSGNRSRRRRFPMSVKTRMFSLGKCKAHKKGDASDLYRT